MADLRRKFFSGILPLNLTYEIVVKSMGSLINLAKYRVGAPPKILEAQNIDEYLALVQLRLILFICLIYFLADVAMST